MSGDALTTVTTAAAAGVVAAALARQLKIPAVVPLLLTGAALGPAGLDVVRPASLGSGVTLVVELIVAVILFEGSITLRAEGLQGHGRRVRSLLTVGAAITMLGASLAAHWVLGLSWPLAWTVGSILVVTGPTVVGPIVAHVRPRGELAEILRWEGILIDAIGALAAVVTLGVVMDATGSGLTDAILRYGRTAGVGIGVGLAAGLLLAWLLRRRRPGAATDAAPLALAACFASFAAAEALHADSGLFATTVAGLVVAWRSPPGLRDVDHFLEGIVAFVLPWVFVLLAAAIVPKDILAWGGPGVLFLLALVAVRALGVAISCRGMPARDLAFLTLVAPRGVVAVMVASFSAAALHDHGIEGAQDVLSIVVLVVFSSVLVVGFTARPAARALGVLAPAPRHVLIVGATRFGVALATALARTGHEVTLVDKNPARLPVDAVPGLATRAGDALAPEALDSVDLDAVGWALAGTPNDEANALICAALHERITRADAIQQLPSSSWAIEQAGRHGAVRWPLAFGERLTLHALDTALAQGGRLRVLHVVDERLDAEGLRSLHHPGLRPLLVLAPGKPPRPISVSNARLPSGASVLCLEAPAPARDRGPAVHAAS